MEPVKAKLKEDTEDLVQYVDVGDSEGIPMKCYNTECVFEILVYKFCGSFIVNRDPIPVPPPQTVPTPKISPGKLVAIQTWVGSVTRAALFSY